MDNLRGLQGIRRMDRIPNAWIRELCGVKKGLGERIDEGVLQWFSHVEGMESDGIAKRVYVGECTGGHSVGGSQRRWIDTMFKEKRFGCLASREKGAGVCKGECMGHSPGD